MARWVTVASLPGAQLRVQDIHDHEACVQEEMIYWAEQIAKVLPDRPDLIVTPECCDRPAGIADADKVPYYRVRGDRMRDFFMQQARQHHANIAYAAMRLLPDGTCRNSIQFINREGRIDGIYNKNMLVIEEHTRQNALYGADVHAIRTDFGRVTGAICFDLNFVQPLKATVREKPELIVFSSAYHGGFVQRHWAYTARPTLSAACSARRPPVSSTRWARWWPNRPTTDPMWCTASTWIIRSRTWTTTGTGCAG